MLYCGLWWWCVMANYFGYNGYCLVHVEIFSFRNKKGLKTEYHFLFMSFCITFLCNKLAPICISLLKDIMVCGQSIKSLMPQYRNIFLSIFFKWYLKVFYDN